MQSVLVVSPHPSVPGGVSVFIECMKRHVGDSLIDSFYIGSTGEGERPLSKLARLLVAPVQLARRVHQKKYDVVHINPSFNAKSILRDGLLLLALRLIGYRRILFYFHGWDFSLQRRVAGNAFLRFVAAWVLNKAAFITVLGAAFRNGLIDIGVERTRIIVTRTMFDGHGLAVREGAPPFKGCPYILFMSRFDREKGGRELLQAFAKLADDYPDLDLVFAGAGADMDFLQTRAEELKVQDRVRFTGYIGGDDKTKLLRDCALFALPTYYRSEGMPLAVLEAMGAGKPLLVGAAGALRSIVSDPANGVVLNSITSQAVEAGLRRLLGDEEFCATAGKRNAEIAWSKFEAHIVTGEIESLYRKVAAC